MKVAIYARISQDRTGQTHGVDRQLSLCRQYASDRGWEVVHEHVDNDLSAYSRTVRRPAFESLLGSTDAFDAVLVWSLDRLLRRVGALQEFIDLGVPIHSLQQGEIDLSTSSGRQLATLVTMFSEEEQRIKSERIRAQRKQEALEGKWSGRRVFGYEEDGTVVPEEAAAIRWAIRAILDEGASTASVVRKWNDSGVLTAKGNKWTPSRFRQMIVSGRFCGWRTYTPTEHDKTGRRVREFYSSKVADGQWERIISPDQTVAIRQHYAARQGKRRAFQKHPLAGFITCGRCANTLSRRVDGERHYYSCIKVEGTTRCGRMSITGKRTEAYIYSQVEEALRNYRPPKQKEPLPDELTAEGLDQRRAGLVRAYASGGISDSDFQNGLALIAKDIERLEASTSIHGWGRFIFTILGVRLSDRSEADNGLVSRWRDASDQVKRKLLDQMVDSIIVTPAKSRSGHSKAEDRITVTFKA